MNKQEILLSYKLIGTDELMLLAIGSLENFYLYFDAITQLYKTSNGLLTPRPPLFSTCV